MLGARTFRERNAASSARHEPSPKNTVLRIPHVSSRFHILTDSRKGNYSLINSARNVWWVNFQHGCGGMLKLTWLVPTAMLASAWGYDNQSHGLRVA